MSTSIVSGVDASPVLEASEHVLDSVALAVEHAIIVVLDAVPGVRRDAWGDALVGQSLPEGGRSIGPVSEQEAGRWQVIDDSGGGLVVVGLALAQMQQERPSLVIAHHLQLGRQSAPAASDTSG